jgi:hypothetical protein
MTSKLQIIPPAFSISDQLFKIGDVATAKPSTPVNNLNGANISLNVNGMFYPLTNQVYSSPSGYNVFYDPLNDHILFFGKERFTQFGVNVDHIRRYNFWRGDFEKWFENCRDTVYAQNQQNGLWNLTFCHFDDQTDFQQVIRTPRDHQLVLPVPEGRKLDYHLNEITTWCRENLASEWEVRKHSFKPEIIAEVKEKTEAVMTKLVWIDGNEEKELP